jgi:hypothetical protein
MGGARKGKIVNEEIMTRNEPVDPRVATSPTAAARETMMESRDTANDQQEGVISLFSKDETHGLRSRWEALQVGFVDEPARAVEEADRLVSEAINSLAKGFSSQRETLEQQWHRDQAVSTEDLRLAFRRYRSFFQRLLTI